MENETLDLGPRSSSAKKLARKILTGAKITEAPVSLYRVVEFLRLDYTIAVELVNFPKKISGLIVTCKQLDDEYTTIGINENEPWCRRRFTLAHELGHLIFGHACNRAEYGEDKVSHNEAEANNFASELLIPTAFIKSDFKNLPNIPALSKLYRVSAQAMSYKLINARLLK